MGNIIDADAKNITNEELISYAKRARESAYSPYSKYAVGAALQTKSGRIYLGCNIENASFSPTCCAERTAFFSAIASGDRDFLRIAIAGGGIGDEPYEEVFPCGVCRQVMREFCDEDFEIIVCGREAQSYRLRELLPHSFSSENVIKKD